MGIRSIPAVVADSRPTAAGDALPLHGMSARSVGLLRPARDSGEMVPDNADNEETEGKETRMRRIAMLVLLTLLFVVLWAAPALGSVVNMHL